MTIGAAKRMKMLMMSSKGRTKETTMILAIWAVKRSNAMITTSRMKMKIALAAGKMKILMITNQTLETTLTPTIIAQKLLILQKQQEPVINSTGIVLLLDLQDLLQQYLLHQDLPETFLGGCLPVVTL